MTDIDNMVDTSGINIPLMERTVCTECDHLHRIVLIRKCACCAQDYAAWSTALKEAGQASDEEEGGGSSVR